MQPPLTRITRRRAGVVAARTVGTSIALLAASAATAHATDSNEPAASTPEAVTTHGPADVPGTDIQHAQPHEGDQPHDVESSQPHDVESSQPHDLESSHPHDQAHEHTPEQENAQAHHEHDATEQQPEASEHPAAHAETEETGTQAEPAPTDHETQQSPTSDPTTDEVQHHQQAPDQHQPLHEDRADDEREPDEQEREGLQREEVPDPTIQPRPETSEAPPASETSERSASRVSPTVAEAVQPPSTHRGESFTDGQSPTDGHCRIASAATECPAPLANNGVDLGLNAAVRSDQHVEVDVVAAHPNGSAPGEQAIPSLTGLVVDDTAAPATPPAEPPLSDLRDSTDSRMSGDTTEVASTHGAPQWWQDFVAAVRDHERRRAEEAGARQEAEERDTDHENAVDKGRTTSGPQTSGNENSQPKEAQDKDAKKKDAEKKDAQEKDAHKKDAQKNDVGKSDREKKTREKKAGAPRDAERVSSEGKDSGTTSADAPRGERSTQGAERRVETALRDAADEVERTVSRIVREVTKSPTRNRDADSRRDESVTPRDESADSGTRRQERSTPGQSGRHSTEAEADTSGGSESAEASRHASDSPRPNRTAVPTSPTSRPSSTSEPEVTSHRPERSDGSRWRTTPAEDVPGLTSPPPSPSHTSEEAPHHRAPSPEESRLVPAPLPPRSYTSVPTAGTTEVTPGPRRTPEVRPTPKRDWPSGVVRDGSAAEQQRGRPADVVVLPVDGRSWQSISAVAALDLMAGSKARPVLQTPMLPSTGATLERCAAGDYRAQWQAFAARLAASRTSPIVDLGFGMNQEGTPWSGDAATYSRCYSEVARTVKKAAPNVAFQWTPVLGSHPGMPGDSILAAWPEHDLVDVIGVDATADGRPWSEQVNGAYGLNYWAAFADRHGRRISVARWGVHPGAAQDRTVNTAYIRNMHDWVAGVAAKQALAYEAYTEPRDVPAEIAAAYRALF